MALLVVTVIVPLESILMPPTKGLREWESESITHPGFDEVFEVSMVGEDEPMIAE